MKSASPTAPLAGRRWRPRPTPGSARGHRPQRQHDAQRPHGFTSSSSVDTFSAGEAHARCVIRLAQHPVHATTPRGGSRFRVLPAQRLPAGRRAQPRAEHRVTVARAPGSPSPPPPTTCSDAASSVVPLRHRARDHQRAPCPSTEGAGSSSTGSVSQTAPPPRRRAGCALRLRRGLRSAATQFCSACAHVPAKCRTVRAGSGQDRHLQRARCDGRPVVEREDLRRAGSGQALRRLRGRHARAADPTARRPSPPGPRLKRGGLVRATLTAKTMSAAPKMPGRRSERAYLPPAAHAARSRCVMLRGNPRRSSRAHIRRGTSFGWHPVGGGGVEKKAHCSGFLDRSPPAPRAPG